MKALVLQAKATPFVVADVSTPPVQSDDVLVRVNASAFNHRDYYIQQGTYPRVRYPIIIGSDGAGIVEDVGSNVSRSLMSSEVVINPSHNWGNNPGVQQKEFTVLGFPDNGTFAEFISVPARYIYPKPKHLSFEEAAALPLAGLTAYRALFSKAQLKSIETVLITGIGGGVAVVAMQFALAIGAKVFVTSGSDEKIARAVALGAVGGANYKSASWGEELMKSAGGFDVIIDGAAGPGFGKLLDVALPGGRIVNYGSVQGKIQHAEPARIFWKQLSIFGSTMGTEDEFAAMIRFVEAKRIAPIVDRVFPFEQANDALQRMAAGEQFGRIVLKHS